MKFQKTDFKNLIICNPTVLGDERGYFFEAFQVQKFKEALGFVPEFVQDNQSRSLRGVLRGLHFQTGNHAQAKLVRVLEGEVLDVVVDLRREERTYGKTFSIRLSAENKTQLYIPRGMAHGFLTLSDHATFFYKCDNYYNAQSEMGIHYNDPALSIDWLGNGSDVMVSEKDKNNPLLSEIENQFTF